MGRQSSPLPFETSGMGAAGLLLGAPSSPGGLRFKEPRRSIIWEESISLTPSEGTPSGDCFAINALVVDVRALGG